MPDTVINTETLECLVPVEEFTATCVDMEKFLALCRECPNYNKRWSCPEFDFDPLSIWAQYDSIHLIARVLHLDTGASAQDAIRELKARKSAFFDELLELEARRPGTLALSAGTCNLCGDVCAKEKGEGCVHPRRLRYSIEALGGNVSLCAEKYLKKPLQWISGESVPEYLTTVGALLLPR